MQYEINGKKYLLNKTVRENKEIRLSFDALSQETFGISFEEWYQNGYWTEKYLPYVLIYNGKVVANVSVNTVDFIWEGVPKKYIQLGTVMTDSEYKGQGLARFLLEHVIKEWAEKCDAIYLFANDTVFDFYPKFGFVKAEEYQCQIGIVSQPKQVRKLDMANHNDKKILFEKYKKSNPFSAFPMVKNKGLLMFYCTQFMKNDVYYVEDFDAIVIKQEEDKQLICFDIFCDAKYDCKEILSAVVSPSITTAILGFSPKEKIKCKMEKLQEDDTTLFMLLGKENIFSDNRIMFPLLSHA